MPETYCNKCNTTLSRTCFGLPHNTKHSHLDCDFLCLSLSITGKTRKGRSKLRCEDDIRQVVGTSWKETGIEFYRYMKRLETYCNNCNSTLSRTCFHLPHNTNHSHLDCDFLCLSL